MGNRSYDVQARFMRAKSAGYDKATASDATVFKQNALRRVNEGMNPASIRIREARDSEAHPCSVPIILQLDVTGSMGRIPADLVRGDLPHLMGNLIADECPDAALMFMAAGDLFCDAAPLQIGQFESGDEELDHWLTNCWLEGGGGGNGGESYSVGWLFALNMVVTDAWQKRGEKGLFISVGDEPLHEGMPVSALKRLFGENYDEVVRGLEASGHGHISAESVFKKVSDTWNVHHIHVGQSWYRLENSWKVIGEGFHVIDREAKVVDKVRDIIKMHMAINGSRPTASAASPEPKIDAPGQEGLGDAVVPAVTKPSIPDPI